jgi:hypothetical protein
LAAAARPHGHWSRIDLIAFFVKKSERRRIGTTAREIMASISGFAP